MCRITAVLSKTPSSGADLLFGGPRSLLAQASAVPGRYQDDGWGIAAFDGRGRLSVTLDPRPARLRAKAFIKAAARPAALSLAHLRAASNPGGLPKARLLGRANTQPFSAGGFAFAHNGTLFVKDEVRSLLGKYAARVKGVNDSEVLFWQVMKMLDAYGAMDKALEMALDEINTVWVSCRDRYPGLKAPYRGLNMFLASADKLAVLCSWPGRNKTALLAPAWEFGRIAWRRDRTRVIISSEPADGRAGWRKMRDGEIAVAEKAGGGLRLSFRRISL